MSGNASGAGAACEGGAAGAGGACALHLRTFGRAEPLDLAAPPPRPNLLAHQPGRHCFTRNHTMLYFHVALNLNMYHCYQYQPTTHFI